MNARDHATRTSRALTRLSRLRFGPLPTSVPWGMALALGAAGISGVAIWLNAFAVRQVPDPAVYTTLKNGVAAVVLIALVASGGRADAARHLRRTEWLSLAVVGLIGGSVPFLLFFSGVASVTAPGAAFIHKTLFVWVALLAVPLLGERLGLLQVTAMGVLLVGQVALAPPHLEGARVGSGEVMIGAATLLWAVEVVIVKRLLADVPVMVVGAARLGIGMVFLLGYLAAAGSLGAVAQVPPAGWAWLALTGLVLAGYVTTWLAALRRAPASAVASILVVGAPITWALQTIANGSVPPTLALAGAALLVAGATLVAAIAVRRSRPTVPLAAQ